MVGEAVGSVVRPENFLRSEILYAAAAQNLEAAQMGGSSQMRRVANAYGKSS